jgi:putative ABC transport system permease protein
MESLWQDLRYGVRGLLKSPAFAALAMVTVAVGIGATTAMFSLVHAAMFEPLPYGDPNRLVVLQWQSTRGQVSEDLNPRQALYISEHNRSLDQVAATFIAPGCNLVGGDKPEYVNQAAVSANFLRTLQVNPELGRDFVAEDAASGVPQVAIISHALWQARFAGDRNVLGKVIRCNGRPYTVVGVMPASFFWPQDQADVWIPDRLQKYLDDNGSNYWVFARLKNGLTVAQARQDLAALSPQFHRDFPAFAFEGWMGKDSYASLLTLREQRLGNDRQSILILFGAVSLLLLIACANVAGLITVRAAGRRREFAVRAALGASRVRIARQLLTETLVVNVAGAVLGVLAAYWSLSALSSLVRLQFAELQALHLNAAVLLFAVAATLVSTLIAGSIPAFSAARRDLQARLKQEEHAAGSSSQQRTRKALIVSEVGLAVMLLVGSALLVRSFLELRSVSYGFDPSGLYAARLSLSSQRYRTSTAAVADFQRQVLERVQTVPGVKAAATISGVPLRRDLLLMLQAGSCQNDGSVQYRAVSANYFDVAGIPLRRGRLLTANESAPAVVVSERLAKICYPNSDPLGSQLQVNFNNKPAAAQIVGIVGDTRDFGPKSRPTLTIYVPQWQVRDDINRFQNGVFQWSILIRAPQAAQLYGPVEAAVHSVDPDQPVIAVTPLQQIAGNWVASPRLITQVMLLFATMALLITAVGLYGLLSYNVAQRTREIGVRMALGAASSDVLRLVLREGLALAAVGAVAGLVAAYFGARLIASELFSVQPHDPAAFVVAALFVLLIALVASTLPARRAARIDPMAALRSE